MNGFGRAFLFERYFTTNTVSVLSYEKSSTRTEFTGSDSIEGEY